MDSSLNVYRNGIIGYSPQGSDGQTGDDGHNLYYSTYEKNNANAIKSLILQNLPLKRQIKTTEHVEYKNFDMILTSDAYMFRINNLKPESVDLEELGYIELIDDAVKNPIEGDIKMVIDGEKNTLNVYNYVNTESPLYRHRNNNDSSCYGNTIKFDSTSLTLITENINKFDGKIAKLIINFNTGLRYEKILNESFSESVNNFFIDNRYFYPYGSHVSDYPCTESSLYEEDSSIWDCSIFDNYTCEIDPSTSIKLSKNIIQGNNDKCLCDAYIEYSYDKKTFRKKVDIQNNGQ